MFFDESPLRKKKAGNKQPVKLDSSRIKYELRSFEEFTDEELLASIGDTLILDTECYKNYWLAAFKSAKTGKVVYFELSEYSDINYKKLMWVMLSFRIITFNGNSYDLPMMWIALLETSNAALKRYSDRIIQEGLRLDEIKDELKFRIPAINHIDLFEVCPLSGSLKKYAARLHCRSLQDLPFEITKELTHEEIVIVRHYCVNDLVNTMTIWDELQPQIKLREVLTEEYNIDLRSKSDAQIAEAVIGSEYLKMTKRRAKRSSVLPGTAFKYNIPSDIRFTTPQMQRVLETVRNAEFVVHGGGGFLIPKEVQDIKINLGNGQYKITIGGLHSQENNVAHKSDGKYTLRDFDVASYYPKIILNQRLYPKELGEEFLTIFLRIVERRLAAKKIKDTVVADCVKIIINGTFGKLGSLYSILYAPDLMIQTTISGQLYLLMLIEFLVSVGMSVVSGNTDGIVVKCERSRLEELRQIIKSFEKHTNFEMEETEYAALYSRDVNSYIAIKPDGEVKLKGPYCDHWKGKRNIFKFHKNPRTTICIQAALDFIQKATPIQETIMNCKDFTKFIAVQDVKGGAVKDGIYLGKMARWYYAENETGCIVYKINGDKVSETTGAKPIMELPESIPDDINYAWYEDKTMRILQDIGYYPKSKTLSLFG